MASGSRPLSLLVVSDLWPPHTIGGYELGACDVVARLVGRGHRATVLTSTYGVAGPCEEGTVHRLLYEEVHPRPLRLSHLPAETLRSARSAARARHLLRHTPFDLVYLFNPLGLSAAFIEELCRVEQPVVAYVSDDWVARWPTTDPLLQRWTRRDPAWPRSTALLVRLGRGLAKVAGLFPRDWERPPIGHAQFVSRYVEQLSRPRLALASAEVIPWGIETTRFRFRERRAEELATGYTSGRSGAKGVHVILEAVALLRLRGHRVSLTLHGRDTTAFARAMRARVDESSLGHHVRFAGARARERLWEEAYDPGGLLVFGSLWKEPFSLTLLEAFASGIPVLTTVTGGTAELVRDGENATSYCTGSASDLAARYEALISRPEEALAMARSARALVEDRLDIERMVDRVEAHLLGVRGGHVGDEAAARVERWLESLTPSSR
jgi:glycosyltransferase involved in cell wall biosynthesis